MVHGTLPAQTYMHHPLDRIATSDTWIYPCIVFLQVTVEQKITVELSKIELNPCQVYVVSGKKKQSEYIHVHNAKLLLTSGRNTVGLRPVTQNTIMRLTTLQLSTPYFIQ